MHALFLPAYLTEGIRSFGFCLVFEGEEKCEEVGVLYNRILDCHVCLLPYF